MILVRLLPILIVALFLAVLGTGLAGAPSTQASFPGTNGKILFTTPLSKIATIRADGTDFLELTTGSNPQWSPDGKRIVFSSAGGMSLMNADGSGIENVNPSGLTTSSPRWSPGGDQLVFVVHGDTPALYISDDDGSNAHRLTPAGLYVAGPASWSPDGNSILFSAFIFEDDANAIRPQGFENAEIFSISPSGGPTQLTHTATIAESLPDWSPDGSRFLYNRDLEDGSEPRSIEIALAGGASIGTVADGSGGDWSPDGTKIVYNGPGGINIVNEDGTNPHFLTAGQAADWGPLTDLVHGVEFTQGIQELQPLSQLETHPTAVGDAQPQAFPGNNGLIAFYKFENNEAVIYTMPPEGGTPTRLVEGSEPSWSADGKSLVIMQRPDNYCGCGIYTVNSDGSDLTPVYLPGDPEPPLNVDHVESPALSSDGEQIAYIRQYGTNRPFPFVSPNFFQIWVMNTDGTNRHAIYTHPEDAEGETLLFRPRWSPDDSKILFTVRSFGTPDLAGIYTISPEGGEAQRVVEGFAGYSADWSPDGDKIVYALQEAFGPRIIHIANANGSGAHPIGPENSEYPIWSPDGEDILFTNHLLGRALMNVEGGNIRTIPGLPGYSDWGTNPDLVHSVEFTQGVQQLQTIPQLQGDIAGDGKPPVPIVAGKPAVMRIYMSEVDEQTEYEIEVTGEVSGSRFVTLTSDCTPQERRTGENEFCPSLDFGFTPPEGEWSTTLKVRRQQDSNVLEEHEFNITSVETLPLVLKPVTICDHLLNPQTGLWNCGSLFNFVNLLPYLRATFPGEVTVAGTSSTIYVDTSEIPNEGDWWNTVADHVKALWTADGAFDNLYEYGVVRPEADAGTTGGLAYELANASAGRTSIDRDDLDGGLPEDIADELIAHLLGINMGLPRIPSSSGCYGTPADPDPAWPNQSSPAIGEVGFDVAEEEPVAETNADWMSLCTPRWISPYTANNVIDVFTPASAASPASTVEGDFWLVSGTLDEEADEVEFDPLFELETEGSDEPGSGLYKIEVRDGADAVLFTRFFKVDNVHREDVGEETPIDENIVRFAELVPVQQNAAKIVVLSLDTPVGEIVLGGATPVVQLTSGISAASLPQSAPPPPSFSWTVTDSDSSDFAYWLELSKDGGTSWTTIAPKYTNNAITLDPATTGGGDNLLMRLRVSDGANTTVVTSEPFTVQDQVPQGSIVTPAPLSEFDPGAAVWLQASVLDPEDGLLDGNAVQWSSSRDGSLGSGTTLAVYNLSLGSHIITMLAKDSANHELADTITITITGATGTDHVWGDADCSGAIAPRDGQALLAFFLQKTPLTQTPPCSTVGATITVTGIGTAVWGDADCSGAIAPRDGQALLAFFLQKTPLTQTPPCKPVGDTATVTGLPATTMRRIE